MSASSPTDMRSAAFRYGVVFAITFVLMVFAVIVPSGAGSRAVVVALELAALLVVISTSRERRSVRRARAAVVGAAGAAVVAGVAAGVLGPAFAFAVAGGLAIAVPAALVTGVLKLVRERGVTLQAIAGALAIYLYVGLLFAWAIAFASAVEDARYFAQGGVSHGDRVYFSFTVLTTTGFGDLTPAHPVGHALAVVEMLTGQLYLVTVIGVMIGNLVQARRRD